MAYRRIASIRQWLLKRRYKPEHLDQEVLAFLTAFPNSHDTALVSPLDTPVLVNHPEMTLTGPKILLTGRSEDGLSDHGKYFDGYNTKSISATRDARGGITVKIFDSPETPNREHECFSPLFLDKATKQMRYSANRGFKRNVVDYQNGTPAEGFTVIEYYNPRLIEGVKRGKEQIELQRAYSEACSAIIKKRGEAYGKRLAEAAQKSEISANA